MKRVLGAAQFMLWVVLAGACGKPPPVQLSTDSYSVVVADGDLLTLRRGGAVLLSFPADAFQLGTVPAPLEDTKSYDPYWLVSSDAFFQSVIPKGLRFRKPTSAEPTQTSPTQIDLALTFEGELSATLTLTADAEGRFQARLVPGPLPSTTAIAFMRLRLRAASDEGFYGMGEVFDEVNHRGKLRPMQLEPDLNLESLNTETHVPVPLLIGTRGWGLFVASKRYGMFDVAREESDLIEVTYGTAEQSGEGLVFHLFAAEHPLDITRRYYDVTGDPLLPAPWALGPWLWRDESLDQAQVLDDVARIRSLDLATSAMWIDRPYATAVNTFDFNPSLFPDPPAMVRTLHDAGLRLALWHTPYLEPAAGALHDEAQASGYFPPQLGPTARWGPPIDFTRPAAFAFWQRQVQRYIDLGVEGFKLDYGEEVLAGLAGAGTGWEFSDGSTERTMQHDFTLLYHRAYAEKVPAEGAFLLCRAGKWGDQKQASVIWPGDIDATLTKWGEDVVDGDKTVAGTGGLPSAVVAGLSLGPSGFPFFGADTGGYRHSPPNRETWIRWVEQSALSTVMQTGDSSSQMPWEYTPANGRDDAALELYRQYARLHLRLFPYQWTLAQRLTTDGRPLQRALGLAYPELGRHPNDEYLFGDDLLVAPVVSANTTSRLVLFPPGEWIDWWDGSVHSGEENVAAPLERLPLYIRRGGIVPMLRPTIDTLSPATLADVDSFANDAGVLWVRAVPEGKMTLYDGTRIDISLSAVGLQSGTVFTKGAVMELLGVGRPASVSLTERFSREEVAASSEGWFWDGALWLRVPAGTNVELTF
ncbi:MAG: TIM-barrel domain-containing protein [Myxococcota bacterium]